MLNEEDKIIDSQTLEFEKNLQKHKQKEADPQVKNHRLEVQTFERQHQRAKELLKKEWELLIP
eukprot:UN15302